MANFFGNLGLQARGYDEGQQVNAKLLEEEQQRRVREQGLEADRARMPLIQQQVRTGQMGLEDTERSRASAAAIRAAVTGADPAAGRAGLYEGVGAAARGTGDLATVEKTQAALKALEGEGFDILARGALTGQPPGQVESEFGKLGTTRLAPGTLEYGKNPETGDILIRAVGGKDGKPFTFNASAYTRMKSKPDVHTVAPGGSAIITQPGTKTQVVTAPDRADRFAPNTRVTHQGIYNEDGQKVGERIIDIESGKEVGGGSGAAPVSSDRNVSKVLPELNAANKALLEIPGMATKTDPNDPMSTDRVLTAQGQAIAPRLEAVVMANRKLPAHQAVLVAMNGVPGQDADGKPVVQYGGKLYPLSGGGGTPLPKPAPRAAAWPALQPGEADGRLPRKTNAAGEEIEIPQSEYPAYLAATARERAGLNSAGASVRAAPAPGLPATVEQAAPGRNLSGPITSRVTPAGLDKYIPQPARRGKPADPDYARYAAADRAGKLKILQERKMAAERGAVTTAGLGG